MERRGEPCLFEHAERVYSNGYLRDFYAAPRDKGVLAIKAAKQALRKKDRTDFRKLGWEIAWQSPQGSSSGNDTTGQRLPAASPPPWTPAQPTHDDLNWPFDSVCTAQEDEDGASGGEADASTATSALVPQHSFAHEVQQSLAEASAEAETAAESEGPLQFEPEAEATSAPGRTESQEAEDDEEEAESNMSQRIVLQERKAHNIGFVGFDKFGKDVTRKSAASPPAGSLEELELEVNLQAAIELDTLNLKSMITCLHAILRGPTRSVRSSDAIDLAWMKAMQSHLDDLFRTWHENAKRFLRAYCRQMQSARGVPTPLSTYAGTWPPSKGRVRDTAVRAKAAQVVLELLSRSLGPNFAEVSPSRAFVRPMDPLLESKIYARQVERREWLQLDEEWYSLFCRVSQKLREFHSSMTLDSSSQSAAKRARRSADFELPWLPEKVREVYSERDVYARIYLLELLREGCGRILTTSRRALRE